MLAKAKRFGKWLGLGILGAVSLYFVAVWIGSSIPRNSDWTEPDGGVTIYIGSNGVHTEIAMPIESETVDWREHFPLEDLRNPDRDYTHVAVSWGEKNFFLDTPTWSEVDPLVAIGALTGGESLHHAAFYVRPAPSDDFRPMRITREQYATLTEQIIADFPQKQDRKTYPGYGSYDVFYDALGSYHIANTCNQWTSDKLAAAGVKTGWWSPLPGGVMKWVADVPQP